MNYVWWDEFIESGFNNKTARDVLPLITGIKKLFKNKKFKEVDILIKEVNIEKLNNLSIAALARACCPAREELFYYNLFIKDSEREVLRRGEDPNNVIKNLI